MTTTILRLANDRGVVLLARVMDSGPDGTRVLIVDARGPRVPGLMYEDGPFRALVDELRSKLKRLGHLAPIRLFRFDDDQAFGEKLRDAAATTFPGDGE